MVLKSGTGDPRGVPTNTTHTGFVLNGDWELEDDYWVRKRDADAGQECAHELLERSRPPNRRCDPHMLVCNCPKCRPHL